MSLSNLQRGDIFLATAHVEAAVRDLPTTDAPLVNALRGLLVSAVLMGRHMIDEATEGREPIDCGGDLSAHEPALDKPRPARGLCACYERELAPPWSSAAETPPPRLELDDDADRLAGEPVRRVDTAAGVTFEVGDPLSREIVFRESARAWDPITDQLVEGDRMTERRAAQVAALLDGGHHGEREC